MLLSERFNEDGIIIDSDKTDKISLINELVDRLVKVNNLETHKEDILNAVMDRENKLSTGIGCGLAVPHAKVEFLDKMFMVAMTVKNGVDFEAIDKEPVFLLFLVLSPGNSVAPHIKALSSVSRIMADAVVRKNLVESEDSDRFMGILKEAEEKYL